MDKNTIVKSTLHSIKFINNGKREKYDLFLKDYDLFCRKVFNHVWKNGYKEFSIKEEKLNIPKYLNYKDFSFIKTELSARAKSSAINQVAQVIKSAIERQRRVIWVRENKNARIKDKKFSKPKIEFFKPLLSSKCCDWKSTEGGKFLGFLRLRSIGKKYGSINIPINFRRKIDGKIRNGFYLDKDFIQICWDVETKPIEKGEKILAIDQGLNSVVTCSDGQKLSQVDNHGHSLKSILDKMSRKKKGSKAFKKTQQHRKQFVNWTINRINFNGVKEVRLEKVVNIRFGRKSSRKLSHWSNPEIRDKIKRKCEELEVPVIEQSSSYRSQRCSSCGLVRKANRKGKVYSCKHCGYCADADFNASLNHLVDLTEVPRAFLGQKYNLGNGFFWKLDGFYNFDGSELRVPDS